MGPVPADDELMARWITDDLALRNYLVERLEASEP